MKKILFLIIVYVFIFKISFSQTNCIEEYKYVYSFKLDNYPTSCIIENEDSNHAYDKKNCKITFICKHQNGDIDSLLYLKIIQNNDTIKLKSDNNGLAECYLKNGYFDLIVNSVTSEEIKFIIAPEDYKSIKNIIIVAGIDYSLKNPIVYSKRQLNFQELFLIKEDIRNKTRNSKLIKNGTCLLLYKM